MLDILIPTSIHNVGLVPDCVSAIAKETDVPYWVHIVVDGGTYDGDEMHEALASAKALEHWTFSHDSYCGYNATLRDAFKKVRHEFVSVIPPQIRIEDECWFGKMQMVFTKDPHAMIIDAFADTISATAYPGKRSLRNLGKNPDIFLARKNFITHLPFVPNNDRDIVNWLERQALRMGGTVWNTPGVRFSVVEHQCHASLAEATPSE